MNKLINLLIAAVSGFLLSFAYPNANIWIIAPVAVFGYFWAMSGLKFWMSVLVSTVFGAVFYGFHVAWMTLYLGPIPWAGLVFGMTCGFTVAGALHYFSSKFLAKDKSAITYVWLWPLASAGIWIFRESIMNVFPYGGFPWGRIGLSQSLSPIAELASLVGITGLSFFVVWVSAYIFVLISAKKFTIRTTAVLLAILLFGIFVPVWPVTQGDSIRVLAVQGNANARLDSNDPPGTVLGNHFQATEPYKNENVDVVIWPENASDIDPLRSSQAATVLDIVSGWFNAPLLTGTITKRDDLYFNTSLKWESGKGATDFYDKKAPVPFAEYMPDREFYSLLAPDLVALVTRDYQFGQTDANFDISGHNLGITICFDIAHDWQIRDLVATGAEIIVVQSNNADFGKTEQGNQQLAIARLQAIQSGRAVIHISTVGYSAIIAPDGTTIDSLTPFEASAMLQNVPTASGITPAMAFGVWIDLLLTWGVFILAIAVVYFRKGLDLSSAKSSN
ncbi:MAG: apolipoprotein N-acyltransferase [Microbacteriaceae bacterium]|nr:apolipoprotein N-acyltransferase [Microbacteriaceae bacterium]